MNLLKDINALKLYIDSLEKNEIQTFFENNFDEILLEESTCFLNLFLEKNVTFKEVVNGLPILSYCINLGVNYKNLEKLINYRVSTNFYNLTTPYEIAIQCTAHIFVFNLLCKKSIIQVRKKSLPLIHQLVDAENLGEMMKLKLIEDLIKHHNLDLNEEVKGEDTIVLKLLNSSQIKLLPKLIIKGADIKEILEGIHYRVHNDILKEIKPYLFKTQPKKTAKKCVSLLNYEDFKQYFKEIEFDKSKRLIHEMLDNPILTDNERIELTKIALEKGSSINERDKNNLTPLEKFTKKYYLYGKTIYVEFLFNNGALIEEKTSACLIYLIKELDLVALEFYLEKGLNPNYLDKQGYSIFSYIPIDHRTKLCYETICLLLDYGFDINQKIKYDNIYISLLFYFMLSLEESSLIIKLLEKYPKIIISTKENILSCCLIYHEDLTIFEYLIEKGIRLNSDIFTICNFELSDEYSLKYLKIIENKFNKNIFSKEKNILECVKSLIEQNKLESLKYIYSILDINLQDETGKTACHYAILFKNYEALNVCLNYLPNLEIMDETGSKAIHYLTNFNYDEDYEIEFLKMVLAKLILYGANINDDFNPLLNFIYTLNLSEQDDFINFEKLIKEDIAQIFLANGADIDFSIKIAQRNGLYDELIYLKKLKLNSLY